jgi:hypothetical protein
VVGWGEVRREVRKEEEVDVDVHGQIEREHRRRYECHAIPMDADSKLQDQTYPKKKKKKKTARKPSSRSTKPPEL